jgi:hypothetical protein
VAGWLIKESKTSERNWLTKRGDALRCSPRNGKGEKDKRPTLAAKKNLKKI